MFDRRLFTPLPVASRRRIADDFLAFAAERDGEPDIEHRLLSRREEFFRDLGERPRPTWTGPAIGADDFDRWHRGARPLRQAPPLAQWLVRVARANEGEGWGVDYLLARGGFDGLGRGGGALQPRDFADLEETYHTRILREIVRLFGVDYELRTPPRTIQQSVKLMAHLPRRLSYMLLAAGEVMGTVAFARMQELGEALLADYPEMRARVRALLDEIMIDEIGHVTFLLGSMNAVELGAIRRLARLYLAAAQRSYYRDGREDAEFIRDGIENYSLSLFAPRVLARAFVPSAYRPAAAPMAPPAKA